MSSKAKYVINSNDGTVSWRTSETDKYPLTYPLIDDETAKAVDSGRISGMVVVEAIKKGIMSEPGFNWEEYDKRRQAEKRGLNVSQHDMIPIGDEQEKEAESDKPEKVVTLASLGLGDAAKGEAKPKAAAAPKAKSASSAVADALGNY